MSGKIHILDGDGSGLQAHVHGFSTAKRKDHTGLLVLTRPFRDFNSELHPFLNEDFGAAMNQNIGFSGTPDLILDGGSGNSEWTASIIAGTWNFADSGKATITSANNNDSADFFNYVEPTNLANFTAITGLVDLDIYNSINNSIIVQFDIGGINVGNSVDINDYIDTGVFTEQTFVIPKADMGLTTQLVDGFNIRMTRIGGGKPTVKFDNVQIEASGTPAVFKATTPLGTRYHIKELRIRIEDAFDSTLANSTIPNFPIDQILGVTQLTNGIVFSRVQNGKTLFGISLKNLGDFLATGSTLINETGNATNSGFTLLVRFPKLIVLEGNDKLNFLSFTINDDLSGLTRFTAAAVGAVEI